MVDFVVALVNTENSGLSDDRLEEIEQATLQAARLWGRYFDAPDVTLEIELDLSGVFGRAGGSSPRTAIIETTEGGTQIFDYISIAELQTGVDTNSQSADIDLFLDPQNTPQGPDLVSLLVHELGHAFGFNGNGLGVPIADLPDLPVQSVFDSLLENIDGVTVFTGETTRNIAGRNIEFSGSISSSNITSEFGLAEYHIGNLPSDFNSSPLAGLGSDLGSAALAGFFLLSGVRYVPTIIDIAILSDIGVPIKVSSDFDDELYGFEAPDPGFEAFYQVPNAPFLNGFDSLGGGLGSDTLYGLSGDDTLRGDAGDDIVDGGAGNDFLVGGGFGAAATEQTTGGADSSLDLTGSDTLFGGAGEDTIVGGGFADTNDNGVYDAGEANLDLAGANTIFAGTGDDLAFGGSDGDVIGGGGGSDTLSGGSGDDTFFGGAADVDGSGLSDVIDGGDGNDTIFSGRGNDSVEGGAGDDELFSGSGTDTVLGGSGNDTIFGGPGDDLFTGGVGADTFAFFAGNGADTITDFELVNDSLDLNGTATDFTDLASVRSAAVETTQNGQSGLLIDTGSGDSIFLIGLTIDNLQSIEIVF
jgi:Ca2+-binding RTX toxin-like protein